MANVTIRNHYGTPVLDFTSENIENDQKKHFYIEKIGKQFILRHATTDDEETFPDLHD